MPTPTTRLGLLKPSTTDPFVTGDIATNWQVLDNSPGIYVCTSTTRPNWGPNQAGMHIQETDTGLELRWDGTQWISQRSGSGWLGGAVGNSAVSTTSTSVPAIGASAAVTVPAGGRRILVVANALFVQNQGGNYPISVVIQRDGATIWGQNNPSVYDNARGQYGSPVNIPVIDLPAAGAHTYRVGVMSYFGYTVVMYNPISLDVFEL